MNREQQAERNRKIAKWITDGLRSQVDAAQEFDLDRRTIHNICKEYGVPTRQEMTKSRDQLVLKMVEQGKSRTEICDKLHMTSGKMARALQRLGITMTRGAMNLDRTLKIVADLQNTNKTLKTIAAEARITRQAVHKIKQRAESAGVKFKGRE